MSSPRTEPDLDAAPGAPVPVVLALGANLGDRAGTLRSAVRHLAASRGLADVQASPVYESRPVGGPPQPAYLNAVVLARTTLPPRAVLALAHAIEDAHGRRREVRWGPRTLDVDVVVYGEVTSDAPDLTLPHPRAAQRAFVLVPWAVLDPGAGLPDRAGARGRVGELAAAVGREGLRARPDVRLDVPRAALQDTEAAR